MRYLILATLALGAIHDDGRKPAIEPVPCELISTKHLTIDAKINGRGPYRFIFDTGSPVVLVNSKVAREAKLNESTRAIPMAKRPWSGQQVAKSIEVGAAKAENVAVAVLDHPTLKVIENIVGPVDGIIGYPFFAQFKTTIDYPALRLTFEPNGYVPDDAIHAIMKSMTERSKKGGATTIAPTGFIGIDVEKPDDQPGVRIKTVFADSPAAAAGLQVGDRMLTLDGRWTDTVEDSFRAAANAIPSQAIIAGVFRGGSKINTSITPKAGF